MDQNFIKNYLVNYKEGLDFVEEMYKEDAKEGFSGYFGELFESNSDLAWQLIQDLVKQSTTQYQIFIIAARPLEDLLCKCGEKYIEQALDRARKDPKFGLCLSGVYNVSDQKVNDRIVAFKGSINKGRYEEEMKKYPER